MKPLLTMLARRYIAGTTMDSAVRAARELNSDGLKATIDCLGENSATPLEADSAMAGYLVLLKKITENKVDSGVSLKLTHMGLDISRELALRNTREVAERALAVNRFVRVDMERAQYVDQTLDVFGTLSETLPNVGITVQSTLLRSEKDVEKLIEKGASVRLVKGAYKEPPGVGFQEKSEVDENFRRLMKELLIKGKDPAIATHDEVLIEEARTFAQANGVSKDTFEFQMLLGIKRTLQKKLASEGYRVRVYVPYGPDWLPYVVRRFGESSENLKFILKNLFD